MKKETEGNNQKHLDQAGRERVYTQDKLSQLCTAFAQWIDEFDVRFLYAILKLNRRRADTKDYIQATIPYCEWHDRFGKDLDKVILKYDEERIRKAIIEIRYYLTFVIAEWVEGFFSDRKQYTHFVTNFREKVYEQQRQFCAQPDTGIWLKYASSKTPHTEKFSHDLVDILGIGRRALEVQLKATINLNLFFIHILPIFVKAIFNDKIKYTIDIEQIWKQYRKTRGDHCLNLLMEHYRHLVNDVAERLHSKLPDEVKLDDLISAGIFGLIDAIETFEPAGGLKFEAYCKPLIRVSILRELKSMDGIPQSVRARVHQLEQAIQNPESDDNKGNKLKND